MRHDGLRTMLSNKLLICTLHRKIDESARSTSATLRSRIRHSVPQMAGERHKGQSSSVPGQLSVGQRTSESMDSRVVRGSSSCFSRGHKSIRKTRDWHVGPGAPERQRQRGSKQIRRDSAELGRRQEPPREATSFQGSLQGGEACRREMFAGCCHRFTRRRRGQAVARPSTDAYGSPTRTRRGRETFVRLFSTPLENPSRNFGSRFQEGTYGPSSHARSNRPIS